MVRQADKAEVASLIGQPINKLTREPFVRLMPLVGPAPHLRHCPGSVYCTAL